MAKKIIVLDCCGFSKTLKDGLENGLGYETYDFRILAQAKDFLAQNEVHSAIVNPYRDFGGSNDSYADFVRKDLKEKRVPVLVFSRASRGRIERDTKLREGEDYAAYLKKPSPLDVFVECVRRLIGN